MGIYKRKGGAADFWYIRYRDADGKLVRRSSGTKDRGEAQAMLAEAEAEVALQKRAKLERAVTEEKPTTRPRRFNWRRWTLMPCFGTRHAAVPILPRPGQEN